MNIYVGNLNYEITEAELRAEFERYGIVKSVNILTFPDSQKARGFGFVEMEHEDEATRAIEGLDGFELKGRNLKVAPSHRKDNYRRDNY